MFVRVHVSFSLFRRRYELYLVERIDQDFLKIRTALSVRAVLPVRACVIRFN